VAKSGCWRKVSGQGSSYAVKRIEAEQRRLRLFRGPHLVVIGVEEHAVIGDRARFSAFSSHGSPSPRNVVCPIVHLRKKPWSVPVVPEKDHR
jgi:hypothetical protein